MARNWSPETKENLSSALCCCSVADLRKEPSIHSERLSQVLFGEQMKLLDSNGDWRQVQMSRDGYVGWIQNSTLFHCDLEDSQAYLKGCNAKVQAEVLSVHSEPGLKGGNTIGKLPFGVRVPVTKENGSFNQVQLPDERLGWVVKNGLLPAESWSGPTEKGIAFTLGLIKRFVGVPYLWGGRSPFGFDCSGLSAAFWEFLGVVIPRDADQQFRAGEPVEGDYRPGDLLFFSSRVDQLEEYKEDRFEAISHVAISLGGYEVIHANGTAWGVSCNSLKPGAQNFRPWLKEHFRGACRYK